MHEPISVITLTRDRPSTLRRALSSVRTQAYEGPIEHLVVVDDDERTMLDLVKDGLSTHHRSVVPVLVRRPPEEADDRSDDPRSIYPRLARLLNIGIRQASSKWIAFLDDDNEYEPDHLSQLMALASASGSPAVHSARQMVWADGTPYLERLFPGPMPVEERARIYELMCARGVWERGTNVLRDRVDPGQTAFRSSTVIGPKDPIFLVDQNVWLLRRDLLLKTPIPELFTEEEFGNNVCPDDKLLQALCKRGVEIISNGAPTVRYYLGGVSNRAIGTGS